MEIIELTQNMIIEQSGKQAAKEFLIDSMYLNQFDDDELDYILDTEQGEER